MNRLNTYKIKDWTVLGRTFFKPPFKVSDTLINEARIVHVVNGHSNLYAANQFTSIQSGDTIIMKSDNFINNWLANESEEKNEVIVFQLTADMLKNIYNMELPPWHEKDSMQSTFPVQLQKNHFLISQYFENLRYYFDHPNLISENLLRIKIKELLFILAAIDASGDNKKILSSLFEANEYKFQEVIQTHLFKDLNLEDLAFLTQLSLSSFKRKFGQIYGTSPKRYFISKRLEKAQLLLRTTDMQVSEIAFECGFTEVGYFGKTFKKHYNSSPSEFRELLLNQ